MSTFPSSTELRAMNPKDLEKARREHEMERAKLHLALLAGKEKNSAKLKRVRRHIAQIKTVQGEQAKGLKQKPTSPTVSAPKAS